MAPADRLAMACLLLSIELSRRVPELQLEAQALAARCRNAQKTQCMEHRA